MSKIEKQYLRRLLVLMPAKGSAEHRFLNDLKNDLDEFVSQHPDSTYETLTQEFGSPLEMFYSYLCEQNTGLLVKQVKLRKNLQRIFVVASFSVLISLGLYTGHLIREYNLGMENAATGYTEIIETYEGDQQ